MEPVIDRKTFEDLHQQVHKSSVRKRLAMVASKGTLDMAYPPLILATTAVALEMETAIFFTFYGLDIINKSKLASLKVAPLANPAMPMPVPNVVGAIPGMTALATSMLKGKMAKQRMHTIPELLDIAIQGGAKLIACTTTMGVMGVTKEELIAEADLGGAATFLEYAAEADVSLFI